MTPARMSSRLPEISIHALLAESDPVSELRVTSNVHFYPRSPCGERQGKDGALLACIKFLSTLSLRRATAEFFCVVYVLYISIHALLAESDASVPFSFVYPENFYPRSPCGERLVRPGAVGAAEDFYPRSPCGERLASYRDQISSATISIHALLAESDQELLSFNGRSGYFYPRSPCGERQGIPVVLFGNNPFLSTLSLRRATGPDCQGTGPCSDFYPRSPCGERPD